MNQTLHQYINQLRNEPEINPGDHNRNRMLASFLEHYKDHGTNSTFNHFQDVIACMLITFKALGADFTLAKESINFIIDQFAESLQDDTP